MSESKPLRVVAAYGQPGTTTLLAAHPDELSLPSRRLNPDRRTLILELEGDQAKRVGEHPVPLVRAWMSANGTAYCCSLDATKIHVSRDGVWSEEELSPTPVDMVADMFGFSGESSAEDVVFATTRGKLFVRKGGEWTAYAAPKNMLLGSVHGRDPDEMYVGGERLLRFDGNRLKPMKEPDHSVRAVRVTRDGRLIGGWDLLSIRAADGSWEQIDTKVTDFMDLSELDGAVYAGTFNEGLLEVYPGPVRRSSPACRISNLFTTGATLIGVGGGVAHVFDGKVWSAITCPSEMGK